VSFLIDPPWLYANGRIAARTPEPVRKPLTAVTVGVFLATSVSLYLNLGWTRWIWRMCRAEDGRDWMLNSGVLSFDHRRAGPRTHAASALLFASYPVWMWLGLRHGRSC
jgi:hypothetical protein